MNTVGKFVGLVNAAHGNAVAKGWWEKERTLPELVALIHSEASEALEDYRNGHEPSKVWYEYKCSMNGTYTSEESTDFVFTTHDQGGRVKGKPCGIPSELADIVIRVFDLVGKLDVAEKFAMALEGRFEGDAYSSMKVDAPFGDNMGWIHVFISKIITGGQEYFDSAKLVHSTYKLAEYSGIDLDAIIAEKMAYNATRPHRHGGKVL